MSSSESNLPWKIRLLNGPYAGEEITLPDESVTIGEDKDCDFIVLEESSSNELDALNFTLFIQEDKPMLIFSDSSEQTSVLINGQEVSNDELSNPLPLPEKVVIDLGKLQFVVGKKEEDLSGITQVEQENKENNDLHQRKKNIKLYLLISVVLTLCLALSVIVIIKSINSPKQSVTYTLPKLVEKLRVSNKLSDVKLSWIQGNTLSMSGYESNDQSWDRFINELQALQVNYRNSVVSIETLVGNITFFLESRGYKGIKVYPDTQPGYVVIKGNIQGNNHWIKTTNLLMQDIPGLKGWSIINCRLFKGATVD